MHVTDWLLDADPAIRWQVLRDLTDAPATEVAGKRARVAREGWGAALLAAQDADGRWGGGTFFGRWPLETTYHERLHVDLGERVGESSRWITLKAGRILRWAQRS